MPENELPKNMGKKIADALKKQNEGIETEVNTEVSEEYTLVGHFDATDEFVEAVKNNSVLEGWGNKIVLITKP